MSTVEGDDPRTCEELLAVVNNPASKPWDLTFAAEALGARPGSPEVFAALLRCLAHVSPVVREGAIYGLSAHYMTPAHREAIAKVRDADPSPAVRIVAADALTGN